MTTQNLRRGLLLLSLSLFAGCSTQAVVIKQCPAIPASLLRACPSSPDPLPATNADLLDQWLSLRDCVEKLRVKLEAIRELNACREEVVRVER